MLVYLEQPQDGEASQHAFAAPIVATLPKIADFLSLGTALLFVSSATAPRLLLKAWTLTKPLPTFSIDLPPPLRLRLSAGVPQVLRGPEKVALTALAARLGVEAGPPLALPLLSETQALLGVLVLIDSPPFDLEDEAFVLAWTQLKYTLLHSLAPKARARDLPARARLEQTLGKGHQLLAARMEAGQLMRHAEGLDLFPYRAKRLVAAALVELAGEQGAVIDAPPLLTAFFVLPGKMDRDLLWHQIVTALSWPPGFTPRWELTVLKTAAELARYLET